MSVIQYVEGSSGTDYTFLFGDYHTSPRRPTADPMLIVRRWFGIAGEGHIVGKTAGRDLRIRALYRGAASEAALQAAVDSEDAFSNELTGSLFINLINHGPATFLGVSMIDDPMPDGKNGLWFVPAIATWRLRT